LSLCVSAPNEWRLFAHSGYFLEGGRAAPVAIFAAGQSCRSAAKTFMVSVASVVKWSQRHRAVGSPAALQTGGHRPYLVVRERDWVPARIAEKPDLTLRALLKELATVPGGQLLCSLAFSPT
jgi:transposase